VSEIFVDTSAWYPLVVRSHPDHAGLSRALRGHIEAGVRVVTTNLVVAETQVLLMRRVGIRAGVDFVRLVRQPPNVVVDSTAELEALALTEWLERFSDQGFSLADAVSFAVMAQRGIRDALTLDDHFAIAGFLMTPGAV